MKNELLQDGALVVERSKAADYLTLTKPELTFLSVVTAVAGFFLGSHAGIPAVPLLGVVVGTALVGGAAGALNQFLERSHDGMMRRTEHRPLPSGRVTPHEGLIFGVTLAVLGIGILAVTTTLLTTALAVATLLLYLLLYTPLKRRTPHATLIGAIPGALPPVMGWTASGGGPDATAAFLFGVLFLWQLPHFLSLAWMYRHDYARAGYRLLPVIDPDGGRTSVQMLTATGVLAVLTVVPMWSGVLGWVYGAGAATLGALFLAPGIRFLFTRANTAARQVFVASLLYLPALMGLMAVDRLFLAH